MTKTTIALGVSLLASACSTELPTGRQTSAVINGDLDNGDPAVVALMDGQYFFCSGTVVSPHVVLTAAHCLEGGPPPDGIFFGTDSNNPGSGTIIPVQSALGHPQYGQDHDIAVVELMSAAPVAPAKRNTTPLGPSMVGQDVRVVGYGLSVDDENSNEAGVKRTGTVRLDSFEADYMMVTPQGGQSGCFGDSGGPNFMTIGGQEVIAGVTSFGTENSCLAGLGGNTDVQKYNDWVDDFIASVGDSTTGPTCGSDGVCEAGCASDPDCTDPGPGDDDAGGDDTGDDQGGAGSGGCSAGGGGASALVALGLLGLCARRRRRA